MNPQSPSPSPSPAYAVTHLRVAHAEWHKLRSLRSTWITVLSASALVLGIGLVMATTYTPGGGDADIDTVVLSLYGTMLSQVVLAVLAILVTAGEYATGMVRASLTAVPSRVPVLWAKAAVFAATAFAAALVTNLVTFLAAQVFLGDTEQAASLTDPGVLRAITGNAAGITLVGLIALGLGALLRSVAGAIGAFIAGVVVVPEILGALPYEATSTAVKYFPTQAAGALGSAGPLPGAASPSAALLALACWAAASLAVAAVLLKRRDV
ncbi:ABC transporter permease [Streptomyces coeruleoprunus]|uniref:ABC transporter permease n=1 Tax=Streptomyces coeruleoprunus TaxID=285563 RepID=A0ABV9XJK8_9ACTN